MAKLRKSGGEVVLENGQLWMIGDGRFISTNAATNGDNGVDVFGRLLDSNLADTSGSLPLISAPLNQRTTSVAALPDGGFLMAFVGQIIGFSGQPTDVLMAQRFDALGNAVAPANFLFNGGAASGAEPRIVLLSDGTAIAAWGVGNGVYARHISINGEELAGYFQVGSSTTSGTSFDIIALDNGGFGVAWSDTLPFASTSSSQIRYRSYSADGAALTAEIGFPSIPAIRQFAPDIAKLADGSLAIAFVNYSGGSGFDDPATGDIYVQRLSSDGTLNGWPILASYDTPGNQSSPSIGALADGGFLIAWSDRGGALGDTDGAVHAQSFNADGSYAGDVWRVNANTTGAQFAPQIFTEADGRVVISWLDSALHVQAFEPAITRSYDGTRGNNRFTANTDDSWIIAGFAGADKLSGAAGDDVLRGGLGNDILSGGAGDDSFEVELNGGFDAIAGGDGFDRILALMDNVTIGVISVSGIERISAMGHSNVTISGDKANNLIDLTATQLSGIAAILGGAGADTIRGSAGDDTILGGVGADLLTGGAGADIFSGTVAEMNGDTIFDFAPLDKLVVTNFNATSGATYSLAGGMLTLDPDGPGGLASLQIKLPGVPDSASWLATSWPDGSLTFSFFG